MYEIETVLETGERYDFLSPVKADAIAQGKAFANDPEVVQVIVAHEDNRGFPVFVYNRPE